MGIHWGGNGSGGLWIVVVVSPVLKVVACVGRGLLLPVGMHCLWVGCCCTGSSSMCGVIAVCRCSLSMGVVCGCLLFAGGGHCCLLMRHHWGRAGVIVWALLSPLIVPGVLGHSLLRVLLLTWHTWMGMLCQPFGGG